MHGGCALQSPEIRFDLFAIPKIAEHGKRIVLIASASVRILGRLAARSVPEAEPRLSFPFPFRSAGGAME